MSFNYGTPTVVERLGRLHGASRLLRQIAEHQDQNEGLELLAEVVFQEARALSHALELLGVHERPCPADGPIADDEGGDNV